VTNTNIQSLYQGQEQFLQKIADIKPLGFGIILCGETALARIYLHHRVSYDLDFFIDGQFDPDGLAIELGRCGINLEEIQIERVGVDL
jgi:hypothetical protein